MVSLRHKPSTSLKLCCKALPVTSRSKCCSACCNPARPIASHFAGSASKVASRTQGTKADTYTWDTLNRLVRVTHPESNGTLKSYRYDYDYRVRRVLRQEGAETTLLMFSGGTSVAELGLATSDFARWQSGVYNHQAQAMQPAPATFTLAKSFVRGSDMGGGVGGLLYSEKQTATAKPGFTVSGGSLGGTWNGGTAYTASASFNHYNGRGDVVAKTDATGAITWTGAYEAYGKRTKETGVNDDRQRANTKDEDPTGLLNEGMRYRDLETGTWLSRDPAGFIDGPNLYAYVRQNPWSKFDPLGLFDADPRVKMIAENDDGSTYSIANRPGGGHDYGGDRAPSSRVQALMNYHTTGDGKFLVDHARTLTNRGANAGPAAELQYRSDDLQARAFLGDKGAAETLRTVDAAAAAWAMGLPGQNIDHQGTPSITPESPSGARRPTGPAKNSSSGEVNPVESATKAAGEQAQHGPYHRLASPTQTGETAAKQQQSGEVWGKGSRQAGGGAGIPAVKAYDGPLPDGKQGVEFTTPVAPTSGSRPGQSNWYQGSPGVKSVDDDTVSIPATVTKNTQPKPPANDD